MSSGSPDKDGFEIILKSSKAREWFIGRMLDVLRDNLDIASVFDKKFDKITRPSPSLWKAASPDEFYRFLVAVKSNEEAEADLMASLNDALKCNRVEDFLFLMLVLAHLLGQRPEVD
jgi:hypothetical protein